MNPLVIACTPTRAMVSSGFCSDLLALCRTSDLRWGWTPEASYLSNQRTLLARGALELGATHILWLDSDMRFPPSTVEGLLARDVAMVGANYRNRQKPECFTAQRDRAWVSSVGRHGVEAVESIGLGVTLIRTDVFRLLPEPWFPIEWSVEHQGHIGEDVGFCRRAGAAGISVWVDHDLSQHVSHLGETALTVSV
jgi:hypothetical protein